MIRFIFFTFSLLFYFSTFPIFAQSEVENNEGIELCKQQFVSFEEIEQNCFKKVSSLSEEIDAERVWFKVTVTDKNKEFIVFDSKVDSIKVFADSKVYVLGKLVHSSDKPFLVGSTMNALQIPSYQEPFYVELISSFKVPINPSIKLVSKDEFNTKYLYTSYVNNLFQICFQGMLWIILIYNLFLFVYMREKVYLTYCVYLFGFSLLLAAHTGLLIDFFVPNYACWWYAFQVTGTTTLLIGYILFLNAFLPNHVVNRFWKRFFQTLYILMIVMLPVRLFLVFVLKNYSLNIPVSTVLNAILLLFILVFFVHLSHKYWSNTLVKFFLIGSFMMIAGGFISNVLEGLGVKLFVDKFIFLQVGGILEILIFSLGLGYRMKQLERKNAQLLLDQNKILEEKVTERTKEIMVQNEELQQQQEEIISQRDYIEKQNNQLKTTNTQFTDSVRYAQTIQEAILPMRQRVKTHFADSFILFRPRDIVSGDFYWIYETSDPITNEEIILIAVLDCTGHGVPGAFISLIGFAILNEIVAKEHIISPAKIVERLDKRLQESLRQRETNNMDGMDVALCSIKKINSNYDATSKTHFEVIFAGAKRPLYYIKDDIFEELKGCRLSVGGITRKKERLEVEFEEEKIILSKGDKIYLTTDGFADQNGDDQQKISSYKLKTSFEEIHNLPFVEQKAKLEQILDNHQGKQNQRDDITILGVKL